MAKIPISVFAAATLVQLGKPVTQENVAKMTAWWQWESGGGNAAAFNPADIIMGAVSNHPDPAGTTPFNTFSNNLHVANYPDVASGVLQTATYIRANPKLEAAFNDGVSYHDGLSQITAFMSGWASPQFMQNIQNTPMDQAVTYGATFISHGKDFTDTEANQLTADLGGATFINPITSNPFDSTSGGVNPLDAAGVGLFNSPLDALKGILKAVTTGAFWKRILYVLGGLVLIFMGLAVLAGHLEGKGDLPKVVPV